MKRIVSKVLGISSGDEASVERYRFMPVYVMEAAFISLIRLFANHCIVPSLRLALFRISGVNIGKNVQVNMGVNFIDGFRRGSISLEDEVSVAPSVSLVSESHPNNSILFREYGIIKTGKILVKKGAWLGVGAIILPGVTVGEAAIIGSNCVVTKDVDDYAIMFGVPAKKMGDVRSRQTDVHNI